MTFGNMSEELKAELIKLTKPLFDQQPHIQLGKVRIYTNYIAQNGEVRFDVADGNPLVTESSWLPRAVANLSVSEATALRDRLNDILDEANLASQLRNIQ